MSFVLPKVYPITDTSISRLTAAEQVRRLADGGARFIQFREKNASGHDFYRDALAALDAARDSGVKLIVNDRVDIALTIGADGVHLGQDDLPPESARTILGENAIVGFSTHNLEQVLAAAKLPIDYIAIGPIFPTTSKIDPDEIVGLGMLSRCRQEVPHIPIVAIGGINAANIVQVLDAGADSAAVISAVLSEPDLIAEKYRNLESLAGIV